jgi:hypothetical protein
MLETSGIADHFRFSRRLALHLFFSSAQEVQPPINGMHARRHAAYANIANCLSGASMQNGRAQRFVCWVSLRGPIYGDPAKFRPLAPVLPATLCKACYQNRTFQGYGRSVVAQDDG